MVQNPAGEVNPIDDIAPLIRSPHLKQTAISAVQLKEVIGL